jgi:hypothetical protein
MSDDDIATAARQSQLSLAATPNAFIVECVDSSDPSRRVMVGPFEGYELAHAWKTQHSMRHFSICSIHKLLDPPPTVQRVEPPTASIHQLKPKPETP